MQTSQLARLAHSSCLHVSPVEYLKYYLIEDKYIKWAKYEDSIFSVVGQFGSLCCCEWEKGHCSKNRQIVKAWGDLERGGFHTKEIHLNKFLKSFCISSMGISYQLINYNKKDTNVKSEMLSKLRIHQSLSLSCLLDITRLILVLFVLVLQVLEVRPVSGTGGLHGWLGSVSQKWVWGGAGPTQMQVKCDPNHLF